MEIAVAMVHAIMERPVAIVQATVETAAATMSATSVRPATAARKTAEAVHHQERVILRAAA